MKSPVGLVLPIVIVAALIIGAATAAPRVRQSRPGPGMRMGQAGIAKALNLSPEQKERIRAILQEHRQRMQDVRNSNGTPEQKRARLSEIRQDTKRRIAEVLTPEQRTEAQRLMHERAGGRGLLPRQAQRCFVQLNLTPEQKEKIKAIRQDGMRAVRDVRANRELSERAKLDRIQVIRKRTHEQVLSVLTPEQREKLRQICPRQAWGRDGQRSRAGWAGWRWRGR